MANLGDLINPLVLRTSPQRNDRNVPVNTTISIEFSEEMDSDTLNNETIILTDSNLNTIECSFSYSNRVVLITPTSYLKTLNEYSVIIVGDDAPQDNILRGVKDLAGNPMVGTYILTFTTADELLTPHQTSLSLSTSIGSTETPDLVPSGNDFTQLLSSALPSSGSCPKDIPLQGTGISSNSYLRILDVKPKNYDTNLDLELGEIRIVFDNRINPLSVIEEGSLKIEVNSVNGDPVITSRELTNSTNEIVTTYNPITLQGNPNDDASYLPAGFTVSDAIQDPSNPSSWYVLVPNIETVEVLNLPNGWRLETTNICHDTIVYGTSLHMLQNNEHIVTIAGAGGTIKDIYGRALQNDFKLVFTSQFNPLWSSRRKIDMKIGSYIKDIIDDTVNRYIFEASLYLVEMLQDSGILPRGVDPVTAIADKRPNFYMKEFVTCKASFDLLNAYSLGQLQSGSGGKVNKKSLGSFSISLDSNNGNQDVQSLINSLKTCTDNQLLALRSHGKQMTSAVKSLYDPKRPSNSRLWCHD